MRLYLVIVEEPFFHPTLVEEIIKKKKKDIVGISLVPDVSPKKSKFKYLKEQWEFFKILPFFYLGLKTVVYSLLNKVSLIFETKKFYSVRGVARHYKIPVYNVKNVNDEDHLRYLKKLKPDVIVSAQGQIFKNNLLKLPKIACINRHSAFLPHYGGLWPVFWAMLNGEEKIGVTVHTMVEKIDGGKIIAQKEIVVIPNDTLYGLYTKAFGISGKVTLNALENLETQPVKYISYKSSEMTYFSNPKIEDIKLFRKMGKKLI